MTSAAIPGLTPVYEDYALCVHCGLCLNSCPTYRLWHIEADSPRGRIHQMIQVAQSEFAGSTQPATPITETFVDHIDKCLDCRACESICPSGVAYGKLVEHARARIERDYKRPSTARVTRDFVFRKLLPYPGRIAAAARLLRFYQRSGLQRLARASGVLKLLRLADQERLLPRIDDSFFFSRLGRTYPAAGAQRARVAFFAGCVAQVTFTALNDATIRVLTANGCEVVVPAGQFCCGALSAHAGVREAARDLARRESCCLRSGEIRRHRHQRCGVRLYAKGIRPSLLAKRARACAGGRVPREGPRRHRIPRRAWPLRSTSIIAIARHLSGFLSSVAWAKNQKPAAAVVGRYSITRFRGIAILGNLLRLRRSLQRHPNAGGARLADRQNAERFRDARAGDCHSKSRLLTATAGRR